MSDTPQQIPPDRPLTVAITWPAARWQSVLTELGQARLVFNIIAPLIGEIERQCMASAFPRREAPPYEMQRGNGAATAETAP